MPQQEAPTNSRGSTEGQPLDGGGDHPHRTLGAWVALVLRSWQVVVAAVLAGLILGALYSLTRPQLFEARSTLVLSPQTGVLDPADSQGLPDLANTIAALTVTDSVLLDTKKNFLQAAKFSDVAKRREDLSLTWMKAHVATTVLANTSLVQIVAQDQDPDSAAQLAAAASRGVIAKVKQLRDGQGVTGGLNVALLGAPTGQGQVSPNRGADLLLGSNVGLILGLLIAVLASNRGIGARGKGDLAKLLGDARVVCLPAPLPGGYAHGKLVSNDLTVTPDEPLQETYRFLRSLLFTTEGTGSSSVAVLGPVAPVVLRGVAAALGAHLCAANATTVIVEADFHGAGWMLDGSGGGMGEVLAGADLRIRELAVPIRRFASESVVDAAVLLAVLPAGIRPPDPSGALGSPAAAALLSRLAGEYRHVIVVGPSSQWQTESTTVSKLTDATLMVVGGTLSVDQTREIKAAYEAEPGRFLAIAVVEARRS